MNYELAKLLASLVAPSVTVFGFWFVWQQLKNTNRQIEIAAEGLKASNKQNTANQDWKRAEFIAAEVKSFYQDPAVAKVLQMLDWNDRRYDLGILTAHAKPVLTRVTQSALTTPRIGHEASYASIEAALRTSGPYTIEEATIRDHFDNFLYYIERFERFLTLNLVSEAEVFPYFRYFIRIIRGELHHVDETMLEAFRAYLRTYHFEDAESFFYCRFKTS